MDNTSYKGEMMKYTAIIDIDEDKFSKHAWEITIYDDENNVIEKENFLNSREACYRISDKYNINHRDIIEECH